MAVLNKKVVLSSFSNKFVIRLLTVRLKSDAWVPENCSRPAAVRLQPTVFPWTLFTPISPRRASIRRVRGLKINGLKHIRAAYRTYEKAEHTSILRKEYDLKGKK